MTPKSPNSPQSDTAPKPGTRLKLYIILAILVSLTSGMVWALSRLDMGFLRNSIATELSETLHLDISIETLSLGFDRGPALKASGLRLRSADKSREIASAREILIAIEWLPLLDKKVQVRRATLVEPVIRIYPKAPHLASPPVETESESPALPLPIPVPATGSKPDHGGLPKWFQPIQTFLQEPQVQLDTLDIRRAKLFFESGKNPPPSAQKRSVGFSTVIEIQRISEKPNRIFADIRELSLGEFHAKGDASITNPLSDTAVLQTRLTLSPFTENAVYGLREWFISGKKPPAFFDKRPFQGAMEKISLSLTAPVHSLKDMQSFVAVAQGDFSAHAQNLTVALDHGPLQSKKLRLDLHRHEHKFSFTSEVELQNSGLSLTGESRQSKDEPLHMTVELRLKDIPQEPLKFLLQNAVAFDTISGSIGWDGPMDELAPLQGGAFSIFDFLMPTGNADSRIALKTKNAVFNFPQIGLPLTEVEFTAAGKLRQNDFDIHGKSDRSSIRFAGTLANPGGGKSSPQVRAQLDARSFNLKSLRLADAKETTLTGVVSGGLKLSSPIDHWAQADWHGDLKGEQIVYVHASDIKSVKSFSLKVPDPALTKTKPIVLRMEDARFAKHLLFKKVEAQAPPVQGNTRPFQARLFPDHGQIDVRGEYRFQEQSYHINFESQDLGIDDFNPGDITGALTLRGQLSGKLQQESAIKSMSGSIKLLTLDGRIHHVEFYETLLTLLNPNTAFEEGLPFKSLGGDFKIADGFVTTNNLELNSPKLKVISAGKADLETQRLEGEISAMPLQLLDNITKAVPILGQLLTGGKKGGLIEIIFGVSGSWTKPKFKARSGKTLLGKSVDVLEQTIKLPQTPTAIDAPQSSDK
jgi:hypothetical protein